jgi:hypothetical protein
MSNFHLHAMQNSTGLKLFKFNKVTSTFPIKNESICGHWHCLLKLVRDLKALTFFCAAHLSSYLAKDSQFYSKVKI